MLQKSSVGTVRRRVSRDSRRMRLVEMGHAPLSGIWQADPDGTYWDDAGHWRRRLQQQHLYNCRAHQAGGAFGFSTLLPGHYVAGAAWRPRHVHIRVQARDLAATSPLSRVHAQAEQPSPSTDQRPS